MISSRICSSKRYFYFIEMPISIMPQVQNKSIQEKGKYPASYSKFNISCSPVLTIQFAQWKFMNRLYFSNNLVRRLQKTLTIVSRKDMLFLYPQTLLFKPYFVIALDAPLFQKNFVLKGDRKYLLYDVKLPLRFYSMDLRVIQATSGVFQKQYG